MLLFLRHTTSSLPSYVLDYFFAGVVLHEENIALLTPGFLSMKEQLQNVKSPMVKGELNLTGWKSCLTNNYRIFSFWLKNNYNFSHIKLNESMIFIRVLLNLKELHFKWYLYLPFV